jgi:hypothetical protein
VLCRQIGTIYYDIYGTRGSLPGNLRDPEFHRQLGELEETFSWQQHLAEENIVGLFGELKVLEKTAILARHEAVPVSNLPAKWKGPDRGVRDFESITGSIEVKTVRKAAADSACLRNIKINHLRQIERYDEHGHHGLVVVPVRKDGGGETVLQLVNRISVAYGISRSSLVAMSNRYLGIDIETDSSELLKLRFENIHPNGLGWGFDMADDLPRIEAHGAIPSIHETGVSYVIDLDRIASISDTEMWNMISNLVKDEA